MADGKDEPAIRDLAGMSGRDPYEVRDALPAALREAGVDGAGPSNSDATHAERKRACVSTVYGDIARLCLEGRASARWVVDKVNEIVADNDYADEVTDPPLGQLSGLDDEWGAGWGRTDAELDQSVGHACRQQLAAPS